MAEGDSEGTGEATIDRTSMSKEDTVRRLPSRPVAPRPVADEHPTVVLDIAALEGPLELPRLPQAPAMPEHKPLPDELQGMYYYG